MLVHVENCAVTFSRNTRWVKPHFTAVVALLYLSRLQQSDKIQARVACSRWLGSCSICGNKASKHLSVSESEG